MESKGNLEVYSCQNCFRAYELSLKDLYYCNSRCPCGGWLIIRNEQTNSGGTKHDSDKPPLSLLPFEALEEVAKVLKVGAEKYEDHNWRKGFLWSRLISATLRHMFAWSMGEDKDPETGLSHIAHVCCNTLFLLSHELNGYGTDDRFKIGENKDGK